MEIKPEIAEILEKMSVHANAWDIPAMMELYSSTAFSFASGKPENARDTEAHCIKAYEDLKGDFNYELKIERVEECQDLACVIGIERITGTDGNGKFDMKMNATYLFRKIGNQWKIVHHHLSVNEENG